MILASSQLPAGENTAYTVPLASTATIAEGTVTNTSASPVTVSVSVVPFGAIADTTHRVVSGYPLAANDVLALAQFIAGAVLNSGDFVSVNVSTGAVVDVSLSGTVTHN